MATLATPKTTDVLGALAHRFTDALRAIAEYAYSTSEAAACAREAARLNSMSDDELAAIGLVRDDIVRHAFSRMTRIL